MGVRVVNPKGYIAICTLWTRVEEVLERIPARLKDRVWGAGTLYTVYGINYMLCTLSRSPSVEYIVLYGKDLSGSGQALVSLFEGRPPSSLKLMWPLEDVARALEGVKLVDLRREYEKGDFGALIRVLESLSPRGGRKPRPLEIVERRVDSWPIPVSGVAIYEESLFAAWVKAVHAVMTYGSVKPSEYGESQKELLNVVVVLGVYGRDCKLEERLLEHIPRRAFEDHVESLFSARRPECVEYTYGERLVAHSAAGDQLGSIVERLRARPESRRAIAVLWDHSRDPHSDNPPCIVLVQGEVVGDYYCHTAYIRSNDMYAGWPVNAYGQLRLAEYVASKLGLKVGVVTTISSSAHVYEHDWPRAAELIKENRWVLGRFVPDPRGNFVFAGGAVEHRAPTGELAERVELRGLSAEEAYQRLKEKALLLDPQHAFWLGARLFAGREI